jgi:hypothetical protein
MSGAWWRRRPARVPAWVVDAGWAVAVAAAVTIAIRVAREPGARPPDLLAYTLGWTIAALLLARRRRPLAVVAASFVALQAYYVLDYPGISAAVPLAVALYSAGAAGHLRWVLVIAGWFVAGPILFRIFVDPEPALPVLGEVVRDASLWLAILLLGALARQHRLLEAERARSEGFLDNMLPEPIAERLKQHEGVIADAFGEVSSGTARVVAPAAPVAAGTRLAAAARPRRKLLLGLSTSCWVAV